MRRILIPLFLIAATACNQDNPEEAAVSGPAPPPATAFAVRGAVSLDRTLEMIEREIVAAEGGDLADRLVRAEAITDRLLETQLPFAWMTARAYGVESLLRQIQSLADRILAEVRSGVRQETIDRDLKDLRDKVRDLRAGLKAGGGPMPLSLDSLLAAYAADTLLKATQVGGE